MTRVTVTPVSGSPFNVDTNAGEIVTALAQQSTGYVIVHDDQSRTVLNMRNVVALSYGAPRAEQLGPKEEVEPTRGEKMIPDPDTNADPDRTVDQLKEALDKAGIDHSSAKVKADFQKLVKDNNL